MFSIHGITGQTFRGSLEHLIQVPGAFAARHARGLNREGEELGTEFELVRRRIADEPMTDPRYAQAAAAYATTTGTIVVLAGFAATSAGFWLSRRAARLSLMPRVFT